MSGRKACVPVVAGDRVGGCAERAYDQTYAVEPAGIDAPPGDARAHRPPEHAESARLHDPVEPDQRFGTRQAARLIVMTREFDRPAARVRA